MLPYLLIWIPVGITLRASYVGARDASDGAVLEGNAPQACAPRLATRSGAAAQVSKFRAPSPLTNGISASEVIRIAKN